MKLIGLTGGIATGKTFVANELKKRKFKVFEADEEARKIIYLDNVQQRIKEIFPNVFKNNIFMKDKLSNEVFFDVEKLRKLEQVILPKVEKKRNLFIKENKNKKILFIEAPLLFEQNYNKVCDKVILIYTDKELQKENALKRKSMTIKKLANIISLQKKDEEKKSLADYLIYNNFQEDFLLRQLDKIIKKIEDL